MGLIYAEQVEYMSVDAMQETHENEIKILTCEGYIYISIPMVFLFSGCQGVPSTPSLLGIACLMETCIMHEPSSWREGVDHTMGKRKRPFSTSLKEI